jgi:glucose-specific phosphotransferase system IIA component
VKTQGTVEQQTVYATQDGALIPLEDMPDKVFAEKMMGDGVCIIPTSPQVKCPINGTVKLVADTLHAIGIVSDDGCELLIHIGIDTVKLKGNGFKVKVKTGDKVTVGDLLATVDLDFIQSQGLQTHTALILTNGNKAIPNSFGQTKAGITPVFTYT